jgi:hypothetical protein
MPAAAARQQSAAAMSPIQIVVGVGTREVVILEAEVRVHVNP